MLGGSNTPITAVPFVLYANRIPKIFKKVKT